MAAETEPGHPGVNSQTHTTVVSQGKYKLVSRKKFPRQKILILGSFGPLAYAYTLRNGHICWNFFFFPLIAQDRCALEY